MNNIEFLNGKSKKIISILVLVIIGLSGMLFSLEENTFVIIDGMDNPLGFTSNDSTLYGIGPNYTGVYKWTEETGVELIDSSFKAKSYSENGYIVGKIDNCAAYITPEGNCISIGNFPGGDQDGSSISTAYAISNDGSIIGGMGWFGNYYTNAFTWTEDGGFVNLNPVLGVSSRVNAMNPEGTIFYGWSTGDSGRIPCKWENGQMTTYPGYNGEQGGEVLGTSSNGEYQCGLSGKLGAVWHGEDSYFSGETAPRWVTVYKSVSNNGIAIGVERNSVMWIQNGIIWSESLGKMTISDYFAMYGIDVPEGYSLDYVWYISDDGKLIAGGAKTPTNTHVAWYVKLGNLSQIRGNVTLNGTSGNIEDVVISNGMTSVNPDADGNYSLFVSEGTYNVTASLPGYYSQTIENIEVGEDQIVNDVDFTLNEFENPATINGTVELISYTGAVEEVTITAGDYSTHPDSDGLYQLIIPAGSYTLSATLEGHYPVEIPEQEYEANQTYTQDFTIYATNIPVQLHGTIIADGGILTNGKVQIDNSNSYVSANGTFTANLEMGEHNVICYIPGFELQTQTVNATVNDLGDGIDITFNMVRKFHEARNLTAENDTLRWLPSLGSNAMYETFESFNVGDFIGSSHPLWAAVSGGNGSDVDTQIIVDPDNENNKNILIQDNNDITMDLMNKDSGIYFVDFDIKVPTGKAAHYNLIHNLYPLTMGIEVFFRENGTMEILHEGQQTDINYNHNENIHISNKVDLDNNSGTLFVNGEEVVNYVWNHDSTTNNIVEYPNLKYLDISAEPRPESNESGEFYIDNVAYYSQDDEGSNALYNVFIGDNLVAENLDANEYALNINVGGNYSLGVQAIYGDETSPISTINYFYNENFLPPTNLEVSSTGLVTWDAPRVLSGYNVYFDDELIAENITETEYQLTDVTPNVTHTIGVSAVYNNEDESEIVTTEYSVVGNSDDIVNYTNQLMGNYPNPFNPTTTIRFSLAKNSQVNVKIYNAKGQLIKDLVNEDLAKGLHNVVWNGNDNAGKKVSSGIYFYKITMSNYQKTNKMLLLK